MSFWNDLATCAADLYELGGVAATYNGAGVTVLPQAGDELVAGREAVADQAAFMVSAAAVAQPVYRDQLVQGGTTWTVRTFKRVTQSDWLLFCDNNQRPVAVPR